MPRIDTNRCFPLFYRSFRIDISAPLNVAGFWDYFMRVYSRYKKGVKTVTIYEYFPEKRHRSGAGTHPKVL